ncbi:PTPRB [Acanthosepion pharaonis]|uniref:protein-tyrosine-phosphatase n=1 Tax=Acanthosepion pharaonis TaxID=158019 RepID=A0A812B3X9_ACAPH|nr:PTPRB [Sepia pharaonis]
MEGLPIPQNIHIISATENSLNVNLDTQPQQQNEYSIRITTDEVANFSKVFRTQEKEYNITSLIPGILYKIFVSIVSDGLQSKEFMLKNYTVPAAPELNISKNGTDYVQLSIKRNGTLCNNFHINEELSNHSRIEEDGEICTMKLVNLEPGRKYYLKMWQTRDVWKSRIKEISIFTELRFIGPVQNFTILNLGARTVEIFLQPPKEKYGDIIGYLIETTGDKFCQIMVLNCSGCNMTKKTTYALPAACKEKLCTKTKFLEKEVETLKKKVTIKNLLPYHKYKILVMAYNKEICGKKTQMSINTLESTPSKPISMITKEGVPSPVVNLEITKVTNTSLEFKWERPCFPNGNITNYRVEYSNEGGMVNHNQTIALAGKLEKLHPYQTYSINVSACTRSGCSKSENVKNRTLAGTPSKVRQLQGTSVSNDSITLKYEAPKHKNGIIISYTIEVCFKKHICRHTPNNTVSICNEFNTTERTYVLKDLKPNWPYIVRVCAWTSKGAGKFSKPISMITKEGVPSPVVNLEITKVTNTSLEFKWERPCFPNGNITNYRVEYSNEGGMVNHNQTLALAGKLEKLHPYQTYSINVSACTRSGCSKSENVKNRTLAGIPLNVKNVIAKPNSSTSVTVRWDQPQDKMGPTNYVVETLDNGKKLKGCKAEGFESTDCTVTGLEEYWSYSFIVTAWTSAGQSKSMESPEVRTHESNPGHVTNLEIGLKCYTRIYVKWEPPVLRERNGIICKYRVNLEQNGSNQTQLVNTTHRYKEFNVKTERNYTVQVRAITKIGEGPITEKTISVPAGPPVIPEGILFSPAPFFAKDRRKQIAILLPMKFFSNDSNGQPNLWGLIVAQSEAVNGNNTGMQKRLNEFHLKNMQRWEDVHDNDIIQAYRPTSDDWKPPPFYGDDGNSHYILGADKDCDMGKYYCNGYLQPGRSYRIKAFMCTRGGCSETKYSGLFYTEKDLSPVYISLPILIITALLSLAAVIFMWRKQLFCFRKQDIPIFSEVSFVRKIGETNKSFVMNLEPKSRSINLDEFHEKVEKMKKDSNLLFCEEFQLLRTSSPSKTHLAAELQANRTKNRYTNILAFDHSRVKLLPLDDEEGSDYINANYMPGYHSKREYIAAQGPLPGTKDDFWRMVWEQNVSVVVMVTQAVERGRIKCEIYWPTGTDPVYFGDLVIQLRSESNLSDYILRILDVQLGDQKREVKHFHFLKWPDFGCPANTSLLINFIQTVRSYMPYTATGPTIIHCSAGVGRTGTFIAIDWLLQHIREHSEVDIFGLILEMRGYRVNMVQTEDQYIFIHQCIDDHMRQISAEEDIYMNETQM